MEKKTKYNDPKIERRDESMVATEKQLIEAFGVDYRNKLDFFREMDNDELTAYYEKLDNYIKNNK